VECFDYVGQFIDIRRFFGDIERDRQFWRDAPGSVVATILDWASGNGFESIFWERASEFPWRSAHEFRQRHLIKAAQGGF
jgi:hypothetical protein